MARLIPPDIIPTSLWDRETDILKLPHSILSTWKTILTRRDLLNDALDNNVRSQVGGKNEAQTNVHYSQSFNGSCARFQLAFLDPKEDLKEVSNAFVKALAGYDVFIIDVPSGTGAASLSLLCNIAQLREEGLLPTNTLNVNILAGDISPTANEILMESFEEVKVYLNRNEINVTLETVIWDVTCIESTDNLVNHIDNFTSNDATEKLLLLANFTGFLEKEKMWDEVKSQFATLFSRYSGDSTTALWLEPKYNISIYNFFPKVNKWFKLNFYRLFKKNNFSIIETSEASFYHGLIENVSLTKVAVVRFNTEE